jgi:hypothetical protein
MAAAGIESNCSDRFLVGKIGVTRRRGTDRPDLWLRGLVLSSPYIRFRAGRFSPAKPVSANFTGSRSAIDFR